MHVSQAAQVRVSELMGGEGERIGSAKTGFNLAPRAARYVGTFLGT